MLTEDVDVLQHYRAALPVAGGGWRVAGGGWRVIEDDAHQLRAERDDMALEVGICDRGGVV